VITYDEIPRELNLASYFLDRNLEEGRGDRPALHCGAETLTFAELSARGNRVGHVLRELGVRPEDRVLLSLSDGFDFVASWFAVLKVGGVVAEAYTFLQPKDYEYYLNYTRAGVAIVDDATVEAFRRVAPRCRQLRHLLVVGTDPVGGNEVSYEAMSAQAPGELAAEPTTKDDVALWKFTTGSTGSPKAAVHLAHDPVVSFHNYALDVLGLTAADSVLPVPKLFFGYARDLTALFNFGVGAAGVIFPERTTPELLFSLIERHGPTVMVQVPTMISAMVNHPEAAEHDLSSLRLCTSAGEALPEDVQRRWLDVFGVEVLDGIGSSEAYHIYISNRPGAVRMGSLGQACPGYEAIVVGEDGAEVPPGEPGELRVRGESTALCYWGDHERSKQTFAGDWILSGDLFVRDGDGYFWYQGRADDLLKVGGIWVAPIEIENCLIGHPAVAECAVVGVEEDGLTRIRAFVVRAEGRDVRADELQGHVRSLLAGHKVPREVRFVESLPKTANDKVDRKALKLLEESAQAGSVSGAPAT
jgi:benzoate-CoA ligase family protein